MGRGTKCCILFGDGLREVTLNRCKRVAQDTEEEESLRLKVL